MTFGLCKMDPAENQDTKALSKRHLSPAHEAWRTLASCSILPATEGTPPLHSGDRSHRTPAHPNKVPGLKT